MHLAQLVEAVPAELVVIGRTNIVALSAGSTTPPRRFDTREDAVKWIRNTLVPGDGDLVLERSTRPLPLRSYGSGEVSGG